MWHTRQETGNKTKVQEQARRTLYNSMLTELTGYVFGTGIPQVSMVWFRSSYQLCRKMIKNQM